MQPIVNQWATLWTHHTGVALIYDGVGSGAGVDQVKKGLVDFAATDAPVSDTDLKAANLTQFPIVTGGIVTVTNLNSIGSRRVQLTGPVLADIFRGVIVRWDDARVKELNGSLSLPSEPITVVHRGDASGITYNFSAYLSRVSNEWSDTLGIGKTVKWPVGLPAEGNGAVATLVSHTANSIGYVEYGYALEHEMQIVGLHSTNGTSIAPNQATIRNTVEAADWAHASHFNLLLVGIQGDRVWPIAATTWIVMPVDQRKTERGRGTLDFVRWCLEHGSEMASAAGYTPLPESLVKLVEASWVKDVMTK